MPKGTRRQRPSAGYTPHNRTSTTQATARETLYRLFAERPMPDAELLINLGLYMRSSAMAKLLFLDEIYRKIVPLPGVVMVFGTWWGQDVIVLHNLRAIHEPYNALRKVVGFDTFTGYPALSKNDRRSETVKPGAYGTSDKHVDYLSALLDYHNQENVMGHIRKHDLVVGDVMATLEEYFDRNPHTLVALAYLDLALYAPTKRVLELLKPRMVKGAIVAMDQLNAPEYPGETRAFLETFGNGQSMYRSAFLPDRTYAVL